MKINPYSKNIIFFDTEFSSLNPYKGEILSLGLVKLNGEELYLELEYEGEIDEWPLKNIVPNLKQEKISKKEAAKQIKFFIGNEKPYVVAYVNQFDMIYFYKLLDLELFNENFQWIPIDLASIFFSNNINPEVIISRDKDFFKELNIDLAKYNQHNALDDAKILRDIYLKITGPLK